MTLREEVTLPPAAAPPAPHRQPNRERDPRAAELLRGHLEKRRRGCELVGRAPGRLDLVARVPGARPVARALGHTDTVRADAGEWSRDPWSGHLVDGEISARVPLDMKSQVAAAAVAVGSLVPRGLPSRRRPRPDADGRRGGERRLRPVVARRREHPELVRADYSLDEGAGGPMRLRRAGVLPLRRRREDERPVPHPRARTQRPCLDAVDRGQRARQGGPLSWRLSGLRAAAVAYPGGAGGSSSSCSARCLPRGRARARARGGSARRRARRAHPLAPRFRRR